MALASLACASPTVAASSLAFVAARATSFRRHYAYAALALRLPLMRPPFPALSADPSGLCTRNQPPLRAQPQSQAQSQPRMQVPMAASGGGKGFGGSSGTSSSRRSSSGGRGGRAGGGGVGGGGSGRGGGSGLADARSSDPAEAFGLPERSVALNELMRVLLEEEMRPPHERMQHAREQRDLAEAALETRQRWDRRREARGRRAERQGRAEAAMDAMDAEEAAIAAAMAKRQSPPTSSPPGGGAADAQGLGCAPSNPFHPLIPHSRCPSPRTLPFSPPLPPLSFRLPATSPLLSPPSLIPAEEELQMFKEWAARKLRGAPRGAEGVAVARGLAHMRRTLEGAVREEQDARRRGGAGGSGGSGGVREIEGSGERGGGVRGRKGNVGGKVEQAWERDQREWGTMWAKGSGGRGAGEGGRRALGDGVAEVVAGLEERRRRMGGGEGEGRRGVRGEGEWGAERGEKRRKWGGERGEVDTRRGERGEHVRARSWGSGAERRGGSYEGRGDVSMGGDVRSVPWLREGGRADGGVWDFRDGARAAVAGKAARAGREGREGREGSGVWAGGEVVERRGRGRLDKGARSEGGAANQKQTPPGAGPPFSPLHTPPAAAAHPLLNSNSSSNSSSAPSSSPTTTTSPTHPGMSPALRALITGRAVGGGAAGGMGLAGTDAFAGQRGLSSVAGGAGAAGGTVLSRQGGPLGGTVAWGSGFEREVGGVRSMGGRAGSEVGGRAGAGSVAVGAGGGAAGVGGGAEDMWDRLESEMSASIEEGAWEEKEGEKEHNRLSPVHSPRQPRRASRLSLPDRQAQDLDVLRRLRAPAPPPGDQKGGHAGTLDPMATGLLVVCVGRATKLADSYQAMTKEYTGVMKLGEGTPSLDADTEVCERSEWEGVTGERLREAAEGFLGECWQVPPAFSALKVGGVRAYAMARKGQEVELKARPVTIEEFDVWRAGEGEGEGRGTYVRTLLADLAQAVGTVGHLVALRRERIGDLNVRRAVSVDEVVQAWIEKHPGEEVRGGRGEGGGRGGSGGGGRRGGRGGGRRGKGGREGGFEGKEVECAVQRPGAREAIGSTRESSRCRGDSTRHRMEVAVRALGAQLAEMRRELAETRREQAETRKEMEELRAMEQRVRMEVAQAREERQAGANEWRHQLAGVSAAVAERERETGEMARAVSALQCKVQGVQGFMRSRAGKGEVAAVRKRLGGLRKGVMGAVRREVAAAVRAEVAAAMGERRGAKQEVQGAVQREEQLEEQREERREECESESKCGSECEHKGLVAQLVQENATLMCEKTVAEAELRELRAQLEALRASQQREGMGMDMGLQPVQGQEEAGRVETHDCKELAGESTAVAAREGEVGEVGRAISALQATVQGGMQSGYVGDVASKVRLAGAWKDVLEAVKKEVTEVVLAVVTGDEDDGARVLTPMQKLRVRMLRPHSEREFRRAMGQRMLRAMCDCENKGCVAHLVQESSEPEYLKKANDASAEVKELKEALGAALRRNDEMGAMVEERAKELAQVKGELNRVLAEWQRQLTEAPRELDVDKEIRESTGDRREIWQA
ncbi:unnamed protein product [Closterium sp. Naga37s-1]|nr:unnamed protein product [Closterium sp. Naga37s-1]